MIAQSAFMSVLNYGDILYSHAVCSTLKQLEAIYPVVLRFITRNKYKYCNYMTK